MGNSFSHTYKKVSQRDPIEEIELNSIREVKSDVKMHKKYINDLSQYVIEHTQYIEELNKKITDLNDKINNLFKQQGQIQVSFSDDMDPDNDKNPFQI